MSNYAISMLPQPGQHYSACTANVPGEYQTIVEVVGTALLAGHWVVLVLLPWDQDVPIGVWFRQDWFMKNFQRLPDTSIRKGEK